MVQVLLWCNYSLNWCWGFRRWAKPRKVDVGIEELLQIALTGHQQIHRGFKGLSLSFFPHSLSRPEESHSIGAYTQSIQMAIIITDSEYRKRNFLVVVDRVVLSDLPIVSVKTLSSNNRQNPTNKSESFDSKFWRVKTTAYNANQILSLSNLILLL